VLVGCQRSDGDGAPAADLRDDYGTRIALMRPPERIVSLNPTTTEILFAIGAGKRLVGRSQYDTFPDSAKVVPSLGPALRPSVEAIVNAKPDLVILYASDDNKAVFDRLRQAAIPTVAFKLDSIEQFRRDTKILGQLVGDTVSARIVVDSVSATLDRVRRATSSLPRPSVFLPTWYKPIIAIGGGFTGDQVVLFGATDGPGDIVAVVRGPDREMTVWRKGKVAGIWVNTETIAFRNVPSFTS